MLIGGDLIVGALASDIKLFYDSENFDPASTYIRVALDQKDALQALIAANKILSYVGGVQTAVWDGYTFAAYDRPACCSALLQTNMRRTA